MIFEDALFGKLCFPGVKVIKTGLIMIIYDKL